MTKDERCATCKHWSSLNGFCNLEGMNTEANHKCFKYREYSNKCDDCPDESCDGNCDCDGKCKEEKPSTSGGCSGCPGKCKN